MAKKSKSKLVEYFTPHRVMLLIITIFLIFLFAYYNVKYTRERNNKN